MTFEEILNQIRSFPCSLVELTGGEPLAQPGAFPLMSALCDRGYNVLVETSGAVPIRGVDHRVRVIMDIKTPGSNMAGRFLDENIQSLIPGDHQVKFVVTSRADFDFALEKISMYHLSDKVDLLISPVFGANGAEVAEWILESGLPLRLQLQLHRVLWPSTDSETADGRER